MKESTKKRTSILIKLSVWPIKKLFPYELLDDGIESAADYIIDKLPEPLSVEDVLEDSKLRELRIPENLYELVRLNVKEILDNFDFDNSKLEQFDYDTSEATDILWEQYGEKNNFSDQEKDAIRKGLCYYLNRVAIVLFDDKNYNLQFIQKICKTESMQQIDIEKLKIVIEEIKRKLLSFEDLSPQRLTDAWPDCQAWWLLSGKKAVRYGHMDDRYSIKLFALLLGMTDPYNIIIASRRPDGLCTRLNRILKDYCDKKQITLSSIPHGYWTSFDNRIPDSLCGLSSEIRGIVFNICADDFYLASELVSNAIEQKKRENPVFPFVFNIWSDDPLTAVSTTCKIQSHNNFCGNVEFLSTISYDILCEDEKPISQKNLQAEFRHLCCNGLTLENQLSQLMYIRDNTPQIWWKIIDELACSNDLDENFLGFLTARPLHSAVQKWLSMVSNNIFSQIKNSYSLPQKLSPEDRDFLYFEVTFLLQKCNPWEREIWKQAQSNLRCFCSDSIATFLSDTDNYSNGQDYLHLDSFTIALWARYASQEAFEKMLPNLRRDDPILYWNAIVNSNYGTNCILDMLADPITQRQLSIIINQTESIQNNNDYYLNMDAYPIRDSIRSYQGEE